MTETQIDWLLFLLTVVIILVAWKWLLDQD